MARWVFASRQPEVSMKFLGQKEILNRSCGKIGIVNHYHYHSINYQRTAVAAMSGLTAVATAE